MKKSTLLALTLLSSPLAVQAAIQADSSISSITVYPDSARVTRNANVTLPAGESQILLPNLPMELDESSLRVSGESAESVALGSVQLERTVAADVVQEREKQLRTEIDNWQRKRQETVDTKARAEQQIEFIRAAGGIPATPAKPEGEAAQAKPVTPLTMEQWQQAWQTLDAATAAAQASIREADKTIAEFDKGLAQLQTQLEQVATGNTTSRTATLHVKTDKPTELKLSLRYQISGASWMPVYDAELDSDSGKLKLKTQAEIRQATGEDWSNAAVTLSTLRPASNAALPELESWPINFMDENVYYPASAGAPPMAMKAMEESAPAADMVAAAPAPAPAPVMRKMETMDSALTSGDYNAEYQIPGAITLASGGDTRRVTLESRQLEGKLELSSVPRLDPRAVLTAKASYDGDAPLIPGPVSLYRDGNFVGSSDLPQLQKGEELKLSFGEDDRVKIKFNPLPENTTEKGLISTRENLERQYEVTVENHHDKNRTIVLYDNIPVAEHEDIRIAQTGEKPDQKDIDGKQGVLAWQREVGDGDSVTLKYGYTVSYPQDKTVEGL
ncbi:MAG: mucoidy inhibitor MuiA family protein [Gammaproteobacteria bacterium]|nr:mucoidy inhibitor MuiA family protein [Gammaproteobacteria bacterium]MBU1725728.1 mucoidy inhibitor MuiA family protein [Gammaproteobacteria bacterium]MBU2003920.1 mucoidy inhibitor MuiA family protein [Gammaproteobacteria bacterium]